MFTVILQSILTWDQIFLRENHSEFKINLPIAASFMLDCSAKDVRK